MRELRITVPCSTSNLGAGFDCIGLAFNRYLHVTYQPGDQLVVDRIGTLANVEGEDIVEWILREQGITGTLILDSTIPVGKGLGSSAAATIAGLAIVAALNNKDLDYDVALEDATLLEGHPDNSAPALLGGLVAVVSDGAKHRAVPLHLSEHIGFVYCAPENATVSTKDARRVLPEHVAHLTATRTIARTVALVEGLAEGDGELLRIGFTDELHVPYRVRMIPGGHAALDAAVGAGAWAATISGSGSGLIAVCERGLEEAVMLAMSGAFHEVTSKQPIAFVAQPDFAGLQIERVP